MLPFTLDQLAGGEFTALVLTRPVLGNVDLNEIKFTGLEGFKRSDGIFVPIKADLVKVVEPACDRQIATPVVGITFEADIFTQVVSRQLVGTTADGHLVDQLVQRLALPPSMTEHRQVAGNQGKLSIDLAKLKTHLAISQHGHAGNTGEIHAVLGRRLFAAELVKGVLHIQREDRVTIVEAGFGTQFKFGRAAIRGHADIVRQQAVGGGRLIQAATQ